MSISQPKYIFIVFIDVSKHETLTKGLIQHWTHGTGLFWSTEFDENVGFYGEEGIEPFGDLINQLDKDPFLR